MSGGTFFRGGGGGGGGQFSLVHRFLTAVVYSCEQYDQASRNCNTSPVAGDHREKTRRITL